MTKTKSKILWTVFSVLLVVYVLFQLTGPKSGAGRRIIDVDPIGSLDGLSEDLKRAFDPAGHFQPVPKPGRGDWLAQHDEPGQSYDRYVNHHCVVNGANNLRESDAQPLHLCPVCLRKLHFAVGFDVAHRYAELGEFYQRSGLEEEASWIKARYEWVLSPDELQ